MNDLAVSGGTLYAVGSFSQANGGTARSGAAAFGTTDGTATAWDPAPNQAPAHLLVRGSSVYLAGGFTTLGGASHGYLAAVDATAGAASAWNPGLDGSALTLGLDGSKLLVGGFFTHAGGTTRAGFAAFDLGAGGTLTALQIPVAGGYGYLTSLLPTSANLFVGGDFLTVAGQSHLNFAGVDPGSGSVRSGTPDANGKVNVLAESRGTAYVGGWFTTFGGAAHAGLAALDEATGAVSPWTVGGDSIPPGVLALSAHGPDLYVGGSFATFSGAPTANLAVYHLAPIAGARAR